MRRRTPQFSIIFDSSAIFAGTSISGRVALALTQPLGLRTLRLRCIGKAQTGWSFKDKNRKIKAIKTAEIQKFDPEAAKKECHAEEIYLDEERQLWHNLFENSHHPRGLYSYAFEFPIPEECPSSFEADSDYGFIRYYCQLVLERPWNTSEIVLTELFSVVGVHDLNADRFSSLSVSETVEKRVGCFCCSRGEISVTAKTPKRGYVSGEILSVTADIENHSSVSLQLIAVYLNQRVIFEADNPKVDGVTCKKFKKTETVFISDRQGIASYAAREWRGEFQIPPLPPTIYGSTVIQIWYSVTLVIDPNTSNKIKIKLPITIGTVPLRHTFRHMRKDKHHPALPLDISQFYPDLPAISFVDSPHGKCEVGNILNEPEGGREFVPRYALYHCLKDDSLNTLSSCSKSWTSSSSKSSTEGSAGAFSSLRRITEETEPTDESYN